MFIDADISGISPIGANSQIPMAKLPNAMENSMTERLASDG